MTKLNDTAQASRVFNPLITPSLEALTVSILDAARALGMGRDAAYSEARAGRLRVIRVGRKIRVPRIELEAYITRQIQGEK